MGRVTDPQPRRRPRLLIAHAVVVLLLTVVLLVLALQPTEDANIGAGLALLPVLLVGLPWSGVLLALDPTTWPTAVVLLASLGAAWVDVALHAGLRGLVLRRRARAAAAPV
jgi:TRAP-type mannitol/chloroaromatic compound transport system permease large subunit